MFLEKNSVIYGVIVKLNCEEMKLNPERVSNIKPLNEINISGKE